MAGALAGIADLTHFVSQDDVTIIRGDAASAYPQELGLVRFDRTLVLAGPDLVVVDDRLAADRPRVFSWLLHHYGQCSRDRRRMADRPPRALLGVRPLLPEG